ncbi:MAG: MFS transporter [Deltaproteobacteria bacterium]|nr:MFS transporter [Deltaproteobacteria bacterium]
MPEPADRRPIASPAFLIAMCCGFGFASYVSIYMRIPVVPLYAASLGADAAQVGLINATFLLTTGFLSFPFGLLSDRRGRKVLVTAGLLVSAVSAFLLCLSRTPAHLIAIYLLFGVGLAAVGPTLMSYVADVSPAGYLGRSYGWYTMAIYSAMSVGPAIGGALAEKLGFCSLFVISGGFVIVIAGLSFLILPDIRLTPAHRHPSWNLRENLKRLLTNRQMLGCWLATLGGCFGMGMFMTFLPLWAHERGLSLARIGLLFMLQAAANALSRLPLGHLCDRPGSRVPLATVGLVSMGAFLGAFGLAHNFLHFLVLGIILGVGMGLTFTPLGALIAEVASPELRGLAMGGYNTVIYLGMMLSSALMGYVIELTGYPVSYLLAGLCLIILAPFSFRMMRSADPSR